ncbi:hypothetical protein ACFQ1I_44875 [Kitasatospora arboriphila]
MKHLCTFVPPHVIEHIARVQGRESLEPTPAQRTAVVSAQFRKALPLGTPDVPAATVPPEARRSPPWPA